MHDTLNPALRKRRSWKLHGPASSQPQKPKSLVPFITYTRVLKRGMYCICGELAEPHGAVWIGVDADGWRPLCVNCASQTELFALIREHIECLTPVKPGAAIVIKEIIQIPEQAQVDEL